MDVDFLDNGDVSNISAEEEKKNNKGKKHLMDYVQVNGLN